jgi:hypothetical protein
MSDERQLSSRSKVMAKKRSKSRMKRGVEQKAPGLPQKEKVADAASHKQGRRRSGAEIIMAEILARQARERLVLDDRVGRERAQEYAEYLAQVTDPTAPARAKSRAAAPAKGRRRLRILAEGDSWFKYPLGPISHPLRDGVIFHLSQLLGYPIANMAHPGEEVRRMLGLVNRQDIAKRLRDPRIRFDALLFSGGGNDLVGDQLIIWLKDSLPPALDNAAIQGALAVLEAEFRELVLIRDKWSPDTVIFVNCYDFPAVTGIPAPCNIGPWLKPSLDYLYGEAGQPVPADEDAVVKKLLEGFMAMLQKVASDPSVKNFEVVMTQGTLEPGDPADWQNEIHPSSAGFRKIAKVFQAALLAKFP